MAAAPVPSKGGFGLQADRFGADTLRASLAYRARKRRVSVPRDAPPPASLAGDRLAGECHSPGMTRTAPLAALVVINA